VNTHDLPERSRALASRLTASVRRLSSRPAAPDSAVEIALGGGSSTAGAAIGELYARAMIDSIHTAGEHIDWMLEHGITNWAFLYEDLLEYWYTRLIPPRRGMVYDIGAHRGRHTRVFTALGRNTVAFEPNPHIRVHLEAEFADNPLAIIRGEALCNRVGGGQFVVNVYAPEESGIERRIYNDEVNARTTTIDVTYNRLDVVHEGREAIAFVKIGFASYFGSLMRAIIDKKFSEYERSLSG